MRLFELGRIAAQAEALRWRQLGRRQVARGILAAVGGVFFLGALTAGHVAGAIALLPRFGALYAVLIVGGVDLLIAAICLGLAARDQPSRIETEALAVREEAQAQMAEAAVMSALVLPMLRRAGFSLAHRLLGGRRK
jgi:hypothetical protein